jgi:CubicO group peptidase (beta-lactamase class C family)
VPPTKSLLAHLVGIAARSGALNLDVAVERYVPELRDSGYRRVPVRALLTMTSGVDWVEDHRDSAGPATALVGAFAAGGSSRALLACGVPKVGLSS